MMDRTELRQNRFSLKLSPRLKQLVQKSQKPIPLSMRLIYRLLKFNHRLKLWLTKYLTPVGLSVVLGLLVFGIVGLDIKRSVSYQVFVFLLALLFVSILLSRFVR